MPMVIAISGSSGLIGKRLIDSIIKRNHTVVTIARKDFLLPEIELLGKLKNVDGVIHLAGAPIIKRWTSDYKKELINSRIETTRKLKSVIEQMNPKPKFFISTSAVGIFPDGGPYTENDRTFFPGFLSELCRSWENEALHMADHLRLIIFRLGIVLDSKEGAFPKMLFPFKLGLGGRIGNGRQGFSWIHIDDVVSAYLYVIENNTCSGIYNLCAPGHVANTELTRKLSGLLKRPAFMPVPAFLLKLIYGEASVTLTSGQRVSPARLLNSGFTFQFSSIESALQHLLRK